MGRPGNTRAHTVLLGVAVEASLQVLTPFAAGVADPTWVVRAAAGRDGTRLDLRYVVGGAVSRVVLPGASAVPQRRDGLWEHTCFEAFLAPAGGAAYWEVNVSASGDWNVYRFDDYRTALQPETQLPAPAIRLERATCGTVTLRATLDLRPVPRLATASLDVGLAVVLERDDGARSHWALRHTRPVPDFHHRAAFVGSLPA